MHSDWEKNVLFIGCLLLLVIFFVGTSITDKSLNRLIMPETPFSTAAIRYNHGISLEGLGAPICLKALKFAYVEVGDDSISIDIGPLKAKIPFVITVGRLDLTRS